MKNERIELRASPEDRENLETAKQKAGKKGVSETIRAAIKNLADQEPKPAKVGYFIHERYYQELINIHSRALQDLKRIAKDFQTLSIGFITSIDLEEMIEGNNFKYIQARYIEAINKDLDKIESQVLRSKMSEDIDDTFLAWKLQTESDITAFRERAFYANKSYTLLLSHFTVKDGEILLTPENEEFIKVTYCTVFVDNPIKERFVELLESCLKDMSEMKAILNRNNIGLLFSLPGVEVGCYDESNDDIVIANGREYVAFIKE